MNTKAKKLINFLNRLGRDSTPTFTPYEDDWKEEHIFNKAKIESHITGKKTHAKFALVFDDGLLYDLFYLYMDKVIRWAVENGLHMEQYNSWNALFYVSTQA